MRYSTQVKPISYLKANATEVLSEIDECREPVIITQNGKAKAVLQDVVTYHNADRVLDRLLDIADSLVTSPERGSIPRELRQLGLNEYRQVLFEAYRLVYRVHGHEIVIYLITDGRRDVQSPLSRRLLRS